ncbi:glycosyltransferase family 1 protein [bacterium]|nr:glycosyltransferase family 1 protein [bacterium]
MRSAMVAYPFSGMRDYGFQDGVHFIASAPEDAGRNVQYLLSNEKVRLEMVEKSYRMVRELHNSDFRAQNLVECMKRLVKGELKGAQFLDGKYEIY